MKISFLLFFILGSALSQICQKENIKIPAEWEKHNSTYMVYPASAKVWKGEENLSLVREDIVRIAKAIAKFETVTMLVDPTQIQNAESLIGGHKNIEIFPLPVDDLWARDTLPVFGYRGDNKELAGVEFNFNGWGGKQVHAKDNKIASSLMRKLNIPHIETILVGEGGSFETDGEGTLLVTESSIWNENRNPAFVNKRHRVEEELKRVLGMKKVIWFDGVYGEDITDAHADCLVRYVKPGVVILNRSPPGVVDSWSRSAEQARKVLDKETDAAGRPFTVIEIAEPDPKKTARLGKDFLSSYVNFYIANGGVIMPKFGDEEADLKAQQTLKDIYPKREIVAVEMNNLAAGGGGIHCATHDIPCYKETAEGIREECK